MNINDFLKEVNVEMKKFDIFEKRSIDLIVEGLLVNDNNKIQKGYEVFFKILDGKISFLKGAIDTVKDAREIGEIPS